MRAGLFALLVLAGGVAEAAQRPAGARSEPGGDLAVYLVTFGPGPLTWERFGHNAIWIRDTLTGTGTAYDFGRFDFRQERFYLRFAQGHMDYWMGQADGVALMEAYLRLGRSVRLQELALPAAQRIGLQRALDAAYARNRGLYRYDYYLDNCSTRVRDALDAATGGALRAQLDTAWTGATYRDHTRRSLDNNLFVYGLVDAALGPFVDRALTRWEEAFLPELLRTHLAGVTVTDAAGAPVPLVRTEVTLSEVERHPVASAPRTWPLVAITLAGVLLAALLLGLAQAGAGRPLVRNAFYLVAGGWALAAGLAGALIGWLWGFSDHLAAHQNVNVLHFNLLSLALVAVLPGAARGRRPRMRAALWLAALLVAGSLIGALLVWGGLKQEGGEIAGFALPAHAAVLVGLLVLRATTPSPSGGPPPPR